MNLRVSNKSFLLFGVLCAAATTASAAPIYLNCPLQGMRNNLGLGFYLTVDYDASSVIVSRRDDAKPLVDYRGSTLQMAQVSDTAITWRIQGYSNHGANYKLDRLSGNLSIYNDDDPSMASTFNCEVVEKMEKPKPKF